MDTEANNPMRRHWALSETRRSVAAGAIALVATGAIEAIWLVQDPQIRPYAATIGVMLAWPFFTVVHLVLTRKAYGSLNENQLRETLVTATGKAGNRTLWGRVRWKLWDRWWRTDAPSWSIQVSVCAFAVVLLVIAVPALHRTGVLLLPALAMVAGSWANVVIMYALHYAKRDLASQGLKFGGDEPRAFSDYLYFALAVQSTFGTTDVNVTTRDMRRTVMVHNCLAFVFNSVIIALIVSLTITVAT